MISSFALPIWIYIKCDSSQSTCAMTMYLRASLRFYITQFSERIVCKHPYIRVGHRVSAFAQEDPAIIRLYIYIGIYATYTRKALGGARIINYSYACCLSARAMLINEIPTARYISGLRARWFISR